MGDLSQSMNAGVGAAGAVNFNFFLNESVDCLFQKFLHTRSVKLFLPAEQVSAVIFDHNLVALHHQT